MRRTCGGRLFQIKGYSIETIGGQSSLDLLFCAGQNAIVIDRSRTENIYSDKPSCYFYHAMGPLKKPKNTKCKDSCFELLLLSGDGTVKETTTTNKTKSKDGCFELLLLSGDGTVKETTTTNKTKSKDGCFELLLLSGDGTIKETQKRKENQRRLF